jgi:transposase
MEQWKEIRRRVLKEGVSKRQILRETDMHWQTLEKILSNSSPPGYCRSKPIRKPKIGPWLGRIEEMLKEDQSKQYHTAKRIWQRLQQEGFTGGYTIVKDAVREIKKHNKEVFMPLNHPPGEAQVDFGYALVRMAGILRKIAFFVMALPHSDGFFVMAFDHECTETFWQGHVCAFEFFGGVPQRITYDNSKVMISKIIGSRKRKLTDGFLQLVSHYLFDYHFCLVRRANEKGVVEGIVRFARLNFMVPVPQVRDFTELNEYLQQMCRDDLDRRLRGKKSTKAQLLKEDRFCFGPLPAIPFDACRVEDTTADSESLVRFDKNDYSVPVEYAHHDIVAKGYTDWLELCHQNKVVAVHDRCWDREQQIFDPRHYLPLLERKPHSLDHGRPFENFILPGCFEILRKRLEADPDKGLREYIRVLRLLEKYTRAELTSAVEKVLPLGAVDADVISQFVIPPKPWGQTTFCLDGREHLRQVKVNSCDVSVYNSLMVWAGGVQ